MISLKYSKRTDTTLNFKLVTVAVSQGYAMVESKKKNNCGTNHSYYSWIIMSETHPNQTTWELPEAIRSLGFEEICIQQAFTRYLNFFLKEHVRSTPFSNHLTNIRSICSQLVG